MPMRLEGRSVLLTGATGGIGGAIAHELAARGCALTVTGRRTAELASLVTELGPPARGFAADLTNLTEVRDLLDNAGPVDILVACAGIDVPQDLADASDEAVEEAMRVNLLAPAALARAAVAPMKKRGVGHIVFIGSVAGLVATPINSSVYTATKWGLRGLGLGCDRSCTEPASVSRRSFLPGFAMRACSPGPESPCRGMPVRARRRKSPGLWSGPSSGIGPR